MPSPAISNEPTLQTAFTPASTGPILVATGGSHDAEAAIAATRLLAERSGASVEVLTVVPSMVSAGFAYGTIPYSREIDTAQRDAQLAAAKAQVTHVLGTDVHWPVIVELGEPALVIANTAAAHGARLVVLGRGRHSRTARLLGGEPVIRVLQLGDTPVLAVAPGMTSLPKRVVVAVDFSELSSTALQVALAYIAPDATVYLAHVMPAGTSGTWEETWNESYQQGLAAAFKAVSAAIVRDQLTIEEVTLKGDPAHELLEHAELVNADLLVCGTHGYGFFRRLVLGSVATELVRNASCSVLSVPGSARARSNMRLQSAPHLTTRSYETSEWDSALSILSERNVGRGCTIEIDRVDIGSQMQGTNIPFVGATYDFHGNAVELMFGDTNLPGRHFSSAIADVNGVAIATDGDGRDRYLSVSTTSGQTLVLFH